jgi:hypothetical protein
MAAAGPAYLGHSDGPVHLTRWQLNFVAASQSHRKIGSIHLCSTAGCYPGQIATAYERNVSSHISSEGLTCASLACEDPLAWVAGVCGLVDTHCHSTR